MTIETSIFFDIIEQYAKSNLNPAINPQNSNSSDGSPWNMKSHTIIYGIS